MDERFNNLFGLRAVVSPKSLAAEIDIIKWTEYLSNDSGILYIGNEQMKFYVLCEKNKFLQIPAAFVVYGFIHCSYRKYAKYGLNATVKSIVMEYILNGDISKKFKVLEKAFANTTYITEALAETEYIAPPNEYCNRKLKKLGFEYYPKQMIWHLSVE